MNKRNKILIEQGAQKVSYCERNHRAKDLKSQKQEAKRLLIHVSENTEEHIDQRQIHVPLPIELKCRIVQLVRVCNIPVSIKSKAKEYFSVTNAGILCLGIGRR